MRLASKERRTPMINTVSDSVLPLHRVLEDEYVCLYGSLPDSYPGTVWGYDIKKPVEFLLKLSDEKSEVDEQLELALLGPLQSIFGKGFPGVTEPVDELRRLKAAEESFRSEVAKGSTEAEKGCEELKKLVTELERNLWPKGSGCIEKSPEGKDEQDVLSYTYVDDLGMVPDNSAVAAPSENTRKKQKLEKEWEKHQAALRCLLAKLLNQRIEKDDLLKRDHFPGLDESTLNNWKQVDLRYANRCVLDRVYHEWLQPLIVDREEENGASDTTAEDQAYLVALYRLFAAQKEPRTSLCLSGGGIRSATFNLGVLQGLARLRLLQQFDYLSTVSGGGYIGSWLSAWRHRHPKGIKGVEKELGGAYTTPTSPEPEAVRHLRRYSNYLSPRTGLLSMDTWTLVAIYMRNLLLNWLVFFPPILAVLMIPRLFVTGLVQYSDKNRPLLAPEWMEPLALGSGSLIALLSIGWAVWHLPGKSKREVTPSLAPSIDHKTTIQSRLLNACLALLMLAAGAFTYFWALLNDEPKNVWKGWENYFGRLHQTPFPIKFILFGVILMLCGLFFHWLGHRRTATGKDLISRLWRLFFLLLSGCVTGLLVWSIASYPVFQKPLEHPRLVVTISAPLLMLLCSIGVSLFVGLISYDIADEDLEWLARVAAWVLIVSLGWIGLCVVVFYAPDLALMPWGAWSKTLKSLTAAVGVLTGVITALGGYSAKTPSGPNSEKPSDLITQLKQQLPSLVAPIFFVFLMVMLVLATDFILATLSRKLGWQPEIWRLTWWEKAEACFANLPMPSNCHRELLMHSGFGFLLLMTVAWALLGLLMSWRIDTGKFSLHSIYGSRLVRAYLGATRKRRPNWFTDFDYNDDLPIHELRPALLGPKSIRNLRALIRRLKNNEDPVSVKYYEQFSEEAKELIKEYDENHDGRDPVVKKAAARQAVVEELNRILELEDLYIPEELHKPRKKKVKRLLKQDRSGETLVLRNRLLLEEKYPAEELERMRSPRPLHILNLALNLMKGENLAWQERKAQSFTVSSLHAGNYELGYRRARHYGGAEGISLGTALTISGAAASPNAGYLISSPLVSFLMAMFNVRLGLWLGNPGLAGNKENAFRRSKPKLAFAPVLSEAFSLTDNEHPYVYLSDGGHFENFGLYEMVLRRCRWIVVSDASTDPDYVFESLGLAVRRIRTDFSIKIEFAEFTAGTESYCAMGRILYSEVDGTDPDRDGWLLYIKPAVLGNKSGNEPPDIHHYKKEHPQFPSEFLGDQFFSESQFESYRKLGSHIIRVVGGGDEKIGIEKFFEQAANHVPILWTFFGVEVK
jgi:hypothetical protein